MSRTDDYIFTGTRVLLTYPQCNDSNKELLLQCLKNVFTDKIQYIVVCKENHHIADEQGFTGEHYHAYIKFNRRTRINANNLIFNDRRPNIQKVSRTPQNAIHYVKKDNDFIEEGQMEEIKLNLKEKYKLIKEHSFNEIFESANLSIAEISKVIQLKKQLITNDWPMDGSKERHVYWFYGATGTGKTRSAVAKMIELHQEDWIQLTGDLSQFFDPYEGQKGVIIDDLRKGSIKWNTLLAITDRYRTSVNIKGSRIPWLAETIIITAPVRPDDLFVDKETRAQWDGLDQLMRRITEIKELVTFN